MNNAYKKLYSYRNVKYLTVIARVNCTIRVTVVIDLTLPQVTLCTQLGVARITFACVTAMRVGAVMLAWIVDALINVC